jgi:hypothetical protein
MNWIIGSRRKEWAGCVECTAEKRNAYRALVGKPERQRLLRRSRRRWKYNIKVDLKEIDGRLGTGLPQKRKRFSVVVIWVINILIP